MARYAEAEKPLIDELKRVGVMVNSVWDLGRTHSSYPAAVPILLQHMSRNYPGLVREGLARALAKPWARPLAWETILEAYRCEPNLSGIREVGEIGAPSGYKEGLACALSEMALSSDLDTLIDLIATPRNGPTRLFFVKNLSRSRKLQAFEALARQSNDPDLRREIEYRLKRKLRRTQISTAKN